MNSKVSEQNDAALDDSAWLDEDAVVADVTTEEPEGAVVAVPAVAAASK